MDKKTPKPQLPLKKFLEQYGKERFEMCRSGETARVQTTVAIVRRFRGTSLSDRVGRFIRGGTGLWRGDGPDDLDNVELKCINIVKPSVKMNMSALSSARVAIDNEAANKEPTLKGAANVADGIFKYLDGNDDHWSGTLESRYCQMIQTGYGSFVQSKHNPKKKAENVETQEWNEEPSSMPGEYACKCGAGGPFEQEINEDEEQPETRTCPKCGQDAEVTKAPEMATIPRPGEKEQFNPGDNETNVYSCLEVRVDERKSQGGNLLQAKWLDHHYLVTDGELEQEFPGYDFGPSGEWCYALKWKFALETGEDVFVSDYQGEEFRKRHERRDIYLLAEEYSHRVEPEDFEIKDGQGNVVFSIKAGEKLIDMFPEAFCYSLVSEKLAPYFREVDFRNEWAYGCYMPDAHSFWGQPIVELLQIQDDWNTLYTIDIQHRERNSINQIIYNSLMFDADSWEKDLVPTGEGYTQDQPLDFYFQQVQAVPMTEAVSGLKFLFEILPYVGGAPPEAIGVDPPGTDNYHAQLLRKQSTLGQLQPPGESKANCKVRWFRNHLKLAQDTWPEQRFEYIRTRFGEEWQPDDIEAFLNCNIERDIVSHYVEGTEIPTSYIERRIDLENVIKTFIEAQQPPPKDLLNQYFDLLGIDYDFEGMESDNRLNDARYETIKTGLKILKGKVPETPTVDPMGQPGPSMLCQQVMSHPQLQVLPKENHAEAVKFYASKETAIMAQEMPDTALIECLEYIIALHEAGGVEAQQEALRQEIAAQQPAIEAQQAMQPEQPDPAAEAQAQADAEAQKQQADAAQKAEDRDFQAADKQAQREHELAKQDKDHTHNAEMEQLKLASQERLAVHQATVQAQAAKEQAKQKASQSKAA